MNAKINLFTLFVVSCSTFLLSSCEKEVYNPSKVDKTTDLVVPEGFDWALTRGVTISMESPKQTSASIYLDEACQSLIAELPVKAGQSTVSLEVPTANSNLWIQYPTQDGKKEVMKVRFKKGAQTRGQWTADALFPNYVDDRTNDMAEPSCYLPEKDKFGTIMFEDMWPELGDYDFNDFVINYNTRTWYKYSEISNDRLDYIYVTMKFKLRAMGGSLPYRFCIQLGNKTNYNGPMVYPPNTVTIQDLEITNNENINGNVEILPGTKSAVIAFTEFEKLKSQAGGSFYNTELAHLNGPGEYPTITFTLKISTENDIKKFEGLSSEFAFDYFLQHTGNNREIHFIDFPPTELYSEGYKKDISNKSETTYYCSDKQFVWALRAPVEMGWSVESKDIAKVYPEFAEWVRRGGDWLEGNSNVDSNRRWYDRPTRDKDLYIDCNNH